MREFASSIAKTTRDYRENEIEPLTTEHVLNWAAQFPKDVRTDLLSGLSHVLKKTYLAKSAVKEFIAGATTSNHLQVMIPQLFGGPQIFWIFREEEIAKKIYASC